MSLGTKIALAGVLLGAAFGMNRCSSTSEMILQGDIKGKHYEIYSYPMGGKRTEVITSNGDKIRYFDNRGFDRQTEKIPFSMITYNPLTNEKGTNSWSSEFGFVDIIEINYFNGQHSLFKNKHAYGKQSGSNGEYENLFKQATHEVKYAVKEILSQRTGIQSVSEEDKKVKELEDAGRALQ